MLLDSRKQAEVGHRMLLARVIFLALPTPFWFDVLNKITRIRSSGEPPDTSAKG